MNNISTQNYQKREIVMQGKFESVKKKYGLFFTPEWIVDFMVQMSDLMKL